ncbi:hypothetical protein C1T17_17020 [Sphingobium sp. SCG-1]|uniref:hypothetical protein n=1 Tax=Sphingobium sp. SCG-1 TaxID=2072936 RepID=UPI000CD6C224|nr:hypothetical protein [Sphingobium sp. SCG-1]AUW59524.1 hypothetical protein C1T17_17020 [Sphingobium sp. SCG-1]
MNDFVTTYGLWLVIALLVLIVVLYLLFGRKSSEDAVDSTSGTSSTPTITSPPIADPTAPPLPTVDPIPVSAPPLPEAVIADAVVPTVMVPITPAATTQLDGSDNLLKMKGVGPKLAALLGELGVTRYAQIAEWTDTDLAAIDARLGNFKGRPIRDHWIDQAKYLAAGDIAGFEAKYGRL